MIAGSFESLENVPDELKRPGTQTVYFPGADLDASLAMAKGHEIEVLRLVSEEDLRMYARALQQYNLDNLDALKLLEESAPAWVKETAIFLHQEQSGNPIFEGVSLMDFLQAAFDIEHGWTVKEGPFTDYVEQAKRQWDRSSNSSQTPPLHATSIPSVGVSRIEKVVFPIDKVNRNIWSALEAHKKDDKQIQYAIDARKTGSETPVDITFCLDFSELESVSITRKLEPYDKRVYLATAALFNRGYVIFNMQQVYNAMGYNGRMSKTDTLKINNSLSKMSSAKIHIDNINESSIYNYVNFQYDGALLPMERITASVNNQVAESAIHIFREPPMVSFARERKQITTINLKVLSSPLSKTNENIELEDYFIEEINRIRRGERVPKMLYETIFENTGIKTKKQKQRAFAKITRLMNHYKECSYILDYTTSKNGVTIKVAPPPKTE